MNTLTNKDKLALQVSLALVAGMFSLTPVVHGAPVLEQVVTGGAKVYQNVANTTAIVPDSTATGVTNNVINWQDFSVGSNEKVIFDAADAAGSSYTKTNNYLNIVTGNGTSYVNGAMKGGNNVYLVNPNGVIMGKNADIDVGNLYVSTKNLNPDDFIGKDLSQGASVLGTTAPEAEVVNMGKIQANSVYAEGTEIRFLNTSDIKYKDVNDTTAINVKTTSFKNLPTMSSTSNAATNSGVTLNGTKYVHVGYEATANNSYSKLDSTNAATELGYNINGNGGARYLNNNVYDGVNPYDYALVNNATQLQNMNTNKSINYMLANDITLSGSFTPVGTDSAPFTGSFDGNYHTITGLNVQAKYAGLFGYTKGENNKNSIRNVGIINPKITADKDGYGGAIAGVTYNTEIENVYAKNTNDEKLNSYYVASAESATSYYVTDKKNSSIYGEINPAVAKAVGGIIGKADGKSTINSVYNDNTVINGGGIVGELDGNSSINNAYNNGVIANSYDYTWDKNNYTSTPITDSYGYTENYINADYVEHYGIVDKITSGTVENVYNSGAYFAGRANDNITEKFRDVAPSSVTNGYVITRYNPTFNENDGTLKLNELSSVNLSSGSSATSATSYAFFPTNSNRSSDGVWRIYDGHSFPLLRSFLRANGNGTIPVSYDLGLYKTKSGGTPSATITDYDSNEVVYNGYYVGASNVKSDNSRGITSGIEASTERIKNAGEIATLFYSTLGQDGYDIADSDITITKRNLVPPYDMTISKVYDGTADATNEMREAFSAGNGAIDVADYYNTHGKNKDAFIQTGLVKTYDSKTGNMVAENVSLSNTAVNSATYYKKGVDISNANNRIAANEAINVSDAKNAANAAQVHVTWNTSAAIDTTKTVDTDLDGVLDHANYDFDVTAFTNGTNTVSGIITERPVYVELQKSTGIDKVYDSTDEVVYKDSGWSSAKDNVNLVSSPAANVIATTSTNGDYGLLASDNATMSVVNAYYTNGSSSGVVPNAGTGYTANYAVTFTSSKAGFDPSNYAVYKYTPASGTSTTANAVIMNTDTNGNYLLTGTGDIDKRIVYTTNAELTYKDPVTGTVTPVDYHKTYDYTSDYTEANGVDFNTTGGTVSVNDAVSQKYTTGIIAGDKVNFSLLTADDSTTAAVENGPTFYKSDQISTANEVADAAHVGYWVNVSGNGASNYSFVNGTANNPGTTVTPVGGNMQIFHTGGIDKRELHLTLNQAADIDKTYDGKADLVDNATRDYGKHTDDSNKGNVTYVTGSDQKIAADGTTWSINAAYKQSGTENADKDVYKANGAVVNNGKNIEYYVSLTGNSLTGNYADNYILYVGNTAYDQAANNPAKLNATGKIDPVTISKVVFGDVNKNYDGTTVVGKAANATGSVQSGNYITITGVTNGSSANAAANGSSVLVSGETLQDVFGAANTTAAGTGGAVTYTGTAITGVYGNTVAYNAQNTGLFSDVNGEHAYAAGTSQTGASRYVKYTGLSTALANDNYVIAAADDDQYGTGRIDPLTITSLSYGNNNVIGATEKVYDGNDNIVGGNQVTYNSDGTVASVTQLGNTTATASIGSLKGSNTSLKITDIPLSYTVNNDSYFADSVGAKTAEAAGANQATKAVYSLTVAPGSNGDYVLGTAADNTYTNGSTTGVAQISGAGTITPRHVFVDGVSQTKEYDGNATIAATGNSVVTMNAQTGQAAVTGLVGGAVNTSTAVYSADAGSGYKIKDANAYTDYNAATNPNSVFRSLTDKTVTFTPSLASGSGNYEFYHNGSKVNSTFDTTGHAIKQKDLQVTFDPIEKIYDGNDYVKTNGNNTVTLTTGTGLGTGDPSYTVPYGDVVTITTQNTSQFLPIAGNSAGALSSSYAGSHDVRYDLEISGADYRNYRLVDGNNNAYALGTNASGAVTATGSGTGVIGKASVNTANATFNPITKVYDGDTRVTYDHTNSDYDASQSLKANSSSFVTGLTLGSYNMAGKYSVLDALTNYNGAGVGNHGVTYTFQITDQGFLNNVSLTGLSSQYNYNSTNHTFTYDTTGSITAKNVYASLTGLAATAAPAKVYNGKTDVVDNTQSNPTGTQWTAGKLGGYMTVTGLVNNGTVNDTATISAAYTNADVAGTGGSEVAYKAAITNPNNYNLYTLNAAGQVVDANGSLTTATNDTLKGTGTITPKELTFRAGYTEKQYDANSLVNGVTVTTPPAYDFDGLVNSETLTPDSSAITGTYVIDDGQGGYTPDPHVGDLALNSNYRAVQYEGLNNAFANATSSNGAKTANYVLAGAALKDATNTSAAGTSASYFNANANNGTAVYGANLANGQITQRYITSINPVFKDITREYNMTSWVGATKDDPTAKQYFELQGSATGMNSSVPVDYNLVEAFFADPVAGYNGTTVTGYDPNSLHKDAGSGFLAVYKVNGLSTNALRDFKLAPSLNANTYVGEYVSKNGVSGVNGATTNTITPRVISGSFTNPGKSNVKVYDGTADAKNIDQYFTLDADDAQFMVKDNVLSNTGDLDDLVKVAGAYNSKDANISPDGAAGGALTGNNKVTYTLSYDSTEQAKYGNKLSNYALANPYVGEGDIRKRIVYVEDTGRVVIEKEYDRSAAADASKRTGTNDFKLLPENAADETGVVSVNGIKDDTDLDLSGVKAEYVEKVNNNNDATSYVADYNVNRKSDGTVINKDVKFTGFALSGTDSANYYLKAKENTAGGDVAYNDATNGGMYIVESDGGKITPKKVSLNVITSPEKTYDATTDVEVADKAGSNLAATKADGSNVSKHFDSANNAVFEFTYGTEKDDVTVEIKGASYDTKDVSVENGVVKDNKTSNFNINWYNGNYDFVSEPNGDTFEEKSYSASGGKVTRGGVLTDHTGKINPLELHIESMDASKTYDGTPYYSYTGTGSPNGLAVSFGNDADAVIQKDINMSDKTAVNNVDFLGLTVANGTYKEATDNAVANVTDAVDAAKDENSAPFTHKMDFAGISLGSDVYNYKLADTSFAYSSTTPKSTGIINRAAVTAHASSGNMYTGSSLPSFTGYFTGFVPGEMVTTTIKEPVTTTTVDTNGNEVTETTYVDKVVTMPWADYYKDYFTWGPDSNIDTSKVGTNPVYGWYRKTVNGVEGLYKSSNLGKNYVLAQDPGTLTITQYVSSGGGGGSSAGSGSARPAVVVTPAPAADPAPASVPSAPAAAPAVSPAAEAVPVVTLDKGYVEKPVVPDSNVYKSVSKDQSMAAGNDASAAIQYGENTTAVSSDKGQTSSSGTVAIEMAEVVNLLGEDVAIDGSMSLSNTDKGKELAVESTEEGYLSVGAANGEGSISIETEDGVLGAEVGSKEGTIGLETEDGLLGAEAGSKEGTIGLETEDGTLLASEQRKELLTAEHSSADEGASDGSGSSSSSSGRNGRISLKTQDGSSDLTITGDDSLVPLEDNKNKKDKEDKEEKDKENSEEDESREGKAAITYSDVA